MLLNYMNFYHNDWYRSSIKFGPDEYKALCYVAKNLGISPTAFVENARVEYNNSKDISGKYSNFTSYVKNKIVKTLLEENKNG